MLACKVEEIYVLRWWIFCSTCQRFSVVASLLEKSIGARYLALRRAGSRWSCFTRVLPSRSLVVGLGASVGL